MLKSLHPITFPTALMNSCPLQIQTPRLRYSALIPLCLMLKSAEFAIAATHWVIVVIVCPVTSAVALTAISEATAKKQSRLPWAYSPLSSLSVTYRCSYPLMTSAYPPRNAAAIPRIPATHLSESASPLTSFFHPIAMTITAVAAALIHPPTTAVAVNKITEI